MPASSARRKDDRDPARTSHAVSLVTLSCSGHSELSNGWATRIHYHASSLLSVHQMMSVSSLVEQDAAFLAFLLTPLDQASAHAHAITPRSSVVEQPNSSRTLRCLAGCLKLRSHCRYRPKLLSDNLSGQSPAIRYKTPRTSSYRDKEAQHYSTVKFSLSFSDCKRVNEFIPPVPVVSFI